MGKTYRISLISTFIQRGRYINRIYGTVSRSSSITPSFSILGVSTNGSSLLLTKKWHPSRIHKYRTSLQIYVRWINKQKWQQSSSSYSPTLNQSSRLRNSRKLNTSIFPDWKGKRTTNKCINSYIMRRGDRKREKDEDERWEWNHEWEGFGRSCSWLIHVVVRDT